MADTIQVTREISGNVVKLKNEVLGEGAVKNELRLMTPEAISSVVESGSDAGMRTSVITFAKTNQTITRLGGDAGCAAVKIATFPKGRIRVFDTVGKITNITCTTNVAADGSGDYAFGTTATEDATIDGTEINLGAKAALIDPFVLGVGASNANSVLSTSAQFDGTGTAVPVYLNVAIDAGDVTVGNGLATKIEGTLTVKWAYISAE